MKVDLRTTCHTKNSIAQNAFKLFGKSGFSKVTIAEICKSAHITRTAFYYYFNCKEELLDYYFVYSVTKDDLEPTLFDHLQAKNIDNFFTLLYKYIDRIIQAGKELTAMFLDRHISSNNPLLSPSSILLRDSLIHSLKAAEEAGEVILPRPAEEMLSCFFYSVIGLIFFWCSNTGPEDLHQSIRNCFDIIFQANA